MNTLPDTLRIPLQDALGIKRPSGSLTEAAFVARIAATFPRYLQAIDEAGNVHFKIGESRTLFAAHADTVHCEEGVNKYTQEGSTVKASGAPLGADDGAGVAILCHMMGNCIPGYYVISRGEEVGGIGASYIADNFPYLLEEFDRSICFDRRGTADIVTVQGGQRCASKEFAEALSIEFQKQDLLYAESEKGVYTDNKEWAYHVMECVNVSCGYNQEHGPKESLDLNHLEKLADAVLKIDWEALPTIRKVIREVDEFYKFDEFDGFNGFDGFDTKASLYGAIEDWYRGGTLPLYKELSKELALRHSIPEAEARMYINLNRLTEEWMEDLPYLSGQLAVLDALLEKTTLN